MKPPSPSAVKAATLIQEEIKDARKRTGFVDVIPGTDEIGAIIDRCIARPVDPDLDDIPRIPESWSREDVARELRAARRRCSEIQTENRRIKLELGTATRLAARETIRAHDAEEALTKSRDAYLNMRDFAEANGLNTATTGEDEDPDGNVYVVTPDSDLGTIKKALEQ